MAFGVVGPIPGENKARIADAGSDYGTGGVQRPSLLSYQESEHNLGAKKAKRPFNRGAVRWNSPRKSRRGRSL